MGLRVIDCGGEPAGALDLRAIFLEHYGFVVRVLATNGLPADEWEDAAQDVFAVVHRRLPDFDPVKPLRPWLWGIARRVAAGAVRRELRARRVLPWSGRCAKP